MLEEDGIPPFARDGKLIESLPDKPWLCVWTRQEGYSESNRTCQKIDERTLVDIWPNVAPDVQVYKNIGYDSKLGAHVLADKRPPNLFGRRLDNGSTRVDKVLFQLDRTYPL